MANKYWIGGAGNWSDLSHWSLSSGGDAIATMGEDLVTNGAFTGNADGWTLGEGWAYNDNKLTYTPGAYEFKRFRRAITTPTIGKRYIFSMNVIGGTAGDVVIGTGPGDGSFDSNSDNFDYNSGVVTWYLDCTEDNIENFAEVLVIASYYFDGSIDDVKVEEVPIPSAEDDVFIDENSGFGGGGIISLDLYYAYCKDFICTSGHTYTISDNLNWNSLYVNGDFQLEEGLTFDLVGGLYFNGSAEGMTIDTAGLNLLCSVNFYGTGDWSLLDDLETSGQFLSQNGTFDANDYNVRAESYYFYADTGYTPTIRMGSGIWEIFGVDIWSDTWTVNQNSGEVVTFIPETSTIKHNANGDSIATSEIANGGSGWVVDDYFCVNVGNKNAYFYVTEVDGNGAVVAYENEGSYGSGYEVANGVSCIPVWGSSGIGLTLNILTVNSTNKTFGFQDSAGTENGKTFNNLWLTGSSTGAFIIKGSNTFNELKIDAGKTVKYEAGKTQTVSSFPNKGTAGNLITFDRHIFVKGSQQSSITIFGNEMFGASFEGNGEILGKIIAHFNRYHTGLSGLFYAKIYAHTGTYGVDGLPTGSVLATSDGVDPNTVHQVSDPNSSEEYFSADGVSEITLSFTGANQITLEDGVKYFIVFSYPSGLSYLNIRNGLTKTRILGNHCFTYDGGSTWSIGNYDYVGDAIFGVYNTSDDFISGNIESGGILSKSSGIVDCDYLDLSYSTAQGGATWYAGANSEDTLKNSGWIFKTYETDERFAKTTGKNTSNDERSAKTSGKITVTSERPAKVHGIDTTDSERSVKTTGKISVNSERSSKVIGKDTAESNRAAKTTGKNTSNSERPAKTVGKNTANSERPAKVVGSDTATDERNSKVIGTNTQYSQRSAKTHGIATSNSERDSKVVGKNTDNSEREVKTTGKNNSFSERLVKLQGVDTSLSERSSKVVGIDTDNSERPVKTTGKASANSERLVKTHGKILDNSERQVKLAGIDTDFSERPGKLVGVDTAFSEKSVKTTGKDTSFGERSATLTGKAAGSSERAAKTHGRQSTLSERQVTLQGQSSAISEISAKTTGKNTANSEISAKLHGKDTSSSEIQAKTTGKDFALSERPVKTVGKDSAVSERLSKTHGKNTSASEKDAKVTGKNTDNSERSVKTHGKDNGISERSIKATGKDTANSERLSKATGKNTSSSERGARLTGKGPWYRKVPKPFNTDNKPNWYTKTPKNFKKSY